MAVNQENMPNIKVDSLPNTPVSEQITELVERKGTGHPDSICDGIGDAISIALCAEYKKRFGHILHHNIDKSLLVAGQSAPKIGGGKILVPMKLVLGDRALNEYKGKKVDVEDIATEATKKWLRENLRNFNPEKDIKIQSEIQPGSVDLLDNFEREKIGANDTSAAVGYAPLTETEQIVLDLERFLNMSPTKKVFPAIGEDIKIMGFRQGNELKLTVAMAFVDKYIQSQAHYFSQKDEIEAMIMDFVAEKKKEIDQVSVDINTLDDRHRGSGGMYLTVVGTSAENGDCGQVGRGNRVNGLIALNRPMSTEAAAGKNPVSHVGKIYNLLSHHIAAHIYRDVPGIKEVYVWLCSQIGHPIEDPLIASAQVIMQKGYRLDDVSQDIETVIREELADIYSFTDKLARGDFMVW